MNGINPSTHRLLTLTLSNSFSRCTRIDVGSLEPSTDSSSSSEMKKKLRVINRKACVWMMEVVGIRVTVG